MKIPHSEGVANHTEPLSCVGHREVSGEAWRCWPCSRRASSRGESATMAATNATASEPPRRRR